MLLSFFEISQSHLGVATSCIICELQRSSYRFRNLSVKQKIYVNIAGKLGTNELWTWSRFWRWRRQRSACSLFLELLSLNFSWLGNWSIKELSSLRSGTIHGYTKHLRTKSDMLHDAALGNHVIQTTYWALLMSGPQTIPIIKSLAIRVGRD